MAIPIKFDMKGHFSRIIGDKIIFY